MGKVGDGQVSACVREYVEGRGLLSVWMMMGEEGGGLI